MQIQKFESPPDMLLIEFLINFDDKSFESPPKWQWLIPCFLSNEFHIFSSFSNGYDDVDEIRQWQSCWWRWDSKFNSAFLRFSLFSFICLPFFRSGRRGKYFSIFMNFLSFLRLREIFIVFKSIKKILKINKIERFFFSFC